MDMCYINVLAKGEQINLLAIMINHIGRIANTTKVHDTWYWFLLTSVFEKLGIPLQKRVGLHVSDEIDNSTLIGCGFKITKGDSAPSEQGFQTPLSPVLSDASTSSGPTTATLLQDSITLKGERVEVKQALTEEKALNAKYHEDLLSVLVVLTAQISSSTFLYLNLFLPLFPTLFFKHLVMYVPTNGLWQFLDSICIYIIT